MWKNPFHRKEGQIGAQGYHVFALPASARQDDDRASAADIPPGFAGVQDVRAENNRIVVVPKS